MATYTYAPTGTGYRTRCRNNSQPGGCQDQHCSFYHGDVGRDQQVRYEDRTGGMKWSTRRGSQGGFVTGISKSGQENPHYEINGIDSNSDHGVHGQEGDELRNGRNGFGGQRGINKRNVVGNEWVDGRKRNSSCGHQADDAILYKEQNHSGNSRDEKKESSGRNGSRDHEVHGQGSREGDEVGSRRNGVGGQGGSNKTAVVENEWVGGRKRNHSWGHQPDDSSFYKDQNYGRNNRSNGIQDGKGGFQDCRDSTAGRFSSEGNSFEIKGKGGVQEQQDYNHHFGGNSRQIVVRECEAVFEENSKNYEETESRNYKYRERTQGPWSGDKDFVKPNMIQNNRRFVENLKKRNFSELDSDLEADSNKFSRKKQRGDIDLRLEKTIVETFDFPEKLIGLLLGKKGATISRIKTLCSPAVVTVPQSCNSRGFREIKLEGFKMQIEKSKGEIYKTFKELRIEHIIESFRKYVEKPRFDNATDSFEYLVEDTGSKLKVEALEKRIKCMDREKYDLQNKVSMLTSTNSGLVEGKNKLQDQINQLNKEMEGQTETIKSLELENKNFRLEHDFNEAASDSWKNISLEQTKQLNFEIETMAHELVIKNRELESRDVVINDLEQTSETRMKEILQLKSEKERDFVQCDKCEEKFRSNELMKRHVRFLH